MQSQLLMRELITPIKPFSTLSTFTLKPSFSKETVRKLLVQLLSLGCQIEFLSWPQTQERMYALELMELFVWFILQRMVVRRMQEYWSHSIILDKGLQARSAEELTSNSLGWMPQLSQSSSLCLTLKSLLFQE